MGVEFHFCEYTFQAPTDRHVGFSNMIWGQVLNEELDPFWQSPDIQVWELRPLA